MSSNKNLALRDNMDYGKAALKKFGAIPENFHIFSAEWLGDKPENWITMEVKGAQFNGEKRVPRTTMTTIVTLADMDAEASKT